jgi:hypothetical protein
VRGAGLGWVGIGKVVAHLGTGQGPETRLETRDVPFSARVPGSRLLSRPIEHEKRKEEGSGRGKRKRVNHY